MCKCLGEALTEESPSQPKLSLQQAVVLTEDEDVLQALEMRGLILILLLFCQLLGDHASVAETRSQPGGKPMAAACYNTVPIREISSCPPHREV